jgi:trk system potassium uptake protein TrkH
MVLAGMNFALVYSFLSGKWGVLWRDVDSRVYLGLILIASFLIAAVLIGAEHYQVADAALRDSLFTVVSLMTTTGHVTADFERWPAFVQGLLIVLMFVGGCAGSTGGGLKVIRWIILIKVATRIVERVFRPRSVRQLRLGGTVVTDEIQQATLGIFLLWMMAFAGGALGIALIEVGHIDLITPFTASAATLNNIGPGFSMVGATQNYGFFSPASKWLMSLLMLLGRLELYAILVLFAPQFWRRQ